MTATTTTSSIFRMFYTHKRTQMLLEAKGIKIMRIWQKVSRGYSICKHSLCVLSQLGFSSLSSYLKAWQPGGRLNKLAVTMNRTTRARSA